MSSIELEVPEVIPYIIKYCKSNVRWAGIRNMAEKFDIKKIEFKSLKKVVL